MSQHHDKDQKGRTTMSDTPQPVCRRARIALFGASATLAVLLVLPMAVLGAATKTVEVKASSFSPASFSVSAGTTIVFKNTSEFPHTATADNGSFDTGIISPGSSKSVVVSKAGRIPFHCQFHGAAGGVGQSGTITVTAAAAAGTPRPTKAATSGSKPAVATPPNTATASDLPDGGSGLAPIAFAAAGVLTIVLALMSDALRAARRDRRQP